MKCGFHLNKIPLKMLINICLFVIKRVAKTLNYSSEVFVLLIRKKDNTIHIVKKSVAFLFCLFFSFLFAFSQARHQSSTAPCAGDSFTSQSDCHTCADFRAGFFFQPNSFIAMPNVSAVNLFAGEALLHPVFTYYQSLSTYIEIY